MTDTEKGDNNAVKPSDKFYTNIDYVGNCPVCKKHGHVMTRCAECLGKDNSGMVPRKEYLMCSTHQVGIMPNRLCGYCELERLSQQPPKEPVYDCGCGMGESCHALKKERKVSLEEISKILICLHEVTGEVYLGNITGTSQSILSLLNAKESTEKEE